MNDALVRGTWIIDLDGVVWLTGIAIPGVAEGVDQLRVAGVRPLFVTNNSAPTDEQLLARLANAGFEAGIEDVVTSAHAAASLIEPGESAFVLGDDGVRAALVDRGVRLAEKGPCDAVVVGWTHDFDFDRLAATASVVRAGARLIGTNEDATHPTPDGLLPGSGALLAAVATASGVEPIVAGKPHPAMVRAIAARRDDIVLVVGDRPETDGLLARRLGLPFALVYSGVSAPGATLAQAPDIEAADLGELVDSLLVS